MLGQMSSYLGILENTKSFHYLWIPTFKLYNRAKAREKNYTQIDGGIPPSLGEF